MRVVNPTAGGYCACRASRATAKSLIRPFPAKRASSGPVVLSLTNAQKLSLAPSTAVGTRVLVSDGIEVSGSHAASAANGFFFPDGTMNGKTRWARFPVQDDGNGNSSIYFFPGLMGYWPDQWILYSGGDENQVVSAEFSGDNPAGADWSAAGAILTNPASQVLVAPSTEQGGVAVDGDAAVAGIYRLNTTANFALRNGRPAYTFLGSTEGNPEAALYWAEDLSEEFRGAPAVPGWALYNFGQKVFYYSSEDVATPDLVASWAAVADDDGGGGLDGETAVAAISVTSVARGDLYAGLSVSGAGSAVFNGPYHADASISQHGAQGYRKITPTASEIVVFGANAGETTIQNDALIGYTAEGRAFPFAQAFGESEGVAPAPAVTSNPVASEASWQAFVDGNRPAQIAGCVLALEADQLALADGAEVTSWPDASGVSTTTVTDLVFRATGFNGHPCVENLGIPGAGYGILKANIPPASARTLYVAGYAINLESAQAYPRLLNFAADDSTGSPGTCSLWVNGDEIWAYYFGPGAILQVGAPGSAVSPFVLRMVLESDGGSVHGTAGRVQDVPVALTDGPGSALGGTSFRLFGSAHNEEQSVARFAAVYLFDRLLSAEEDAAIVAAMRAKFGL